MKVLIFLIGIGAALIALPADAQTSPPVTRPAPRSTTPVPVTPSTPTKPGDPLVTGTPNSSPSGISPSARDEIMKKKSDAIDAKVKRGICQGC